MFTLPIPNKTEVSPQNSSYIEYLTERIGHIPNLYAAMMHSAHAFSAYYPFHIHKTALSIRESEAIGLLVSQLNGSLYCLSAHTMIGGLNDFSEEEMMEMRQGTAHFEPALDALLQLVKNIVEKQGAADELLVEHFFSAGYTPEHLIDVMRVIGDNFITNFTAKALNIPIDFPLAKEL